MSKGLDKTEVQVSDSSIEEAAGTVGAAYTKSRRFKNKMSVAIKRISNNQGIAKL